MTDVVRHGAHMDRLYRWQAPIYDLTRKYYLIGRDTLIAELDPSAGGHVLEIGCGTGRNLDIAGRRHAGCRLFGVDISASMLEEAKRTLGSRAQLALGDACSFDPNRLFARPTFDRVFISYALSMIPGWGDALRRAFDLVAPGGRLSVVDFGRMDGVWPPAARFLRHWLGAFSVEPRADLPEVFAAAAQSRGFAFRVDELKGGYAVYARATLPLQSNRTSLKETD